ncbi:hypothetical protein MON38_03460 [Hymenobacter sp. DH14]|uniref:DUF4350 domain-containing protein n=1 Tax=Hymenobacter cyanobacteriorum TaxID=2926463 RepID=A0A9X2AGL6_9BACT|nr:DUF4350 domain-containing protein [Hymenobacter cyanobacteriorum]MCI1186460.1 hypothetical protein [Hymenobacter cyanobacteriorum]
MKMNLRWYLGGLLLLFAAYVALEYNRPKPIDWTPTLVNKDRIPYGTYVLYDQLPRLLGTDSVATSRLPIYNQLTGLSLETSDALAEAQRRTVVEDNSANRPAEADSSANFDTDAETDSTAVAASEATDSAAATAEQPPNSAAGKTTAVESDTAETVSVASADTSEAYEDEDEEEEVDWQTEALLHTRPNYLFVNTTFNATPADLPVLLRYAALGHNVFVVAESFRDAGQALLDTLGLRIRRVPLTTRRGPRGLPVPDSVTVRFSNPALAGPRYRLPGADADLRFATDSTHPHPAYGPARALAADAQGRPVLVRCAYGRGYIYLCTVPIAFTNQFVLRPATSQFAATALSYLPARATWWDEYQKQGRVGNQSLLRLITTHEALNTAWYLLLIGGVLFVLVEARRRQRIIPTIRPLPNTTLLFTRTVASLYRQGRSHGAIAEKKIGLFLDYLRTRFQEPSPDFGDEAFRERLSQKSGLARPRVDELLRLVNFARTAPQLNDQQLLQLSRALSDFRREAGR